MSQPPVEGTYSEDVNAFYVEEVCGQSDHAYRFAFASILDRKQAFEATKAAYAGAVDHLGELHLQSAEQIRLFLIRKIWQDIQDKHFSPTSKPESQLGQKLAKLPLLARAVFFAVDVCGCTVEEVKSALTCDDESVRHALAESRKFLVEEWGV